METRAFLLVALLATAACTSTTVAERAGTPLGRLEGNYVAGGQPFTVDGHPVICDTAGSPGRSVTRCY